MNEQNTQFTLNYYGNLFFSKSAAAYDSDAFKAELNKYLELNKNSLFYSDLKERIHKLLNCIDKYDYARESEIDPQKIYEVKKALMDTLTTCYEKLGIVVYEDLSNLVKPYGKSILYDRYLPQELSSIPKSEAVL